MLRAHSRRWSWRQFGFVCDGCGLRWQRHWTGCLDGPPGSTTYSDKERQMKVMDLRRKLEQLEQQGYADSGLYVWPQADLADASHELGRGILINFDGPDYPPHGVNHAHTQPEDADCILLTFTVRSDQLTT